MVRIESGRVMYCRNKMNEYLCRSFVAEQIVEKMTPSRVERRAGKPPPTEPRPMLMDEGSSQYKNWLARSPSVFYYANYNYFNYFISSSLACGNGWPLTPLDPQIWSRHGIGKSTSPQQIPHL